MIYPEDKIICINSDTLKGNDKGPDLHLGRAYKALQVIKCKCGETHIDVGLKLNCNWVTCYICRQELPGDEHWCHSSRFIK